ncbi:ROK family protein [Paraburkholderia sp. J8-2]|uniref:ROK family protein n=1 Tax=Paraburkholderia sp. J8-2 TaxID=2805440 RepID=UPI002AB74DB2|nr:ROK family protein [Paraburkholderia sp. J8-2]
MNVLRRAAMPRAAVTTHLDLAQQSVHRLIEQLIERGLLVAGEPVRNGRGQPSPQIDLARDAAFAVGVYVNADCAVISLADLGCNVREELLIRTPQSNRVSSLSSLNDALSRMLSRNGVPRERVVGLGFAVPGFFIGDGHQLNAVLPLRDWSLVDLQPMLEESFQLPVWIQNSHTTAAIGEALSGVGRWARNFAYLAFNYGFSCGIVINGSPYFGSHGNAGDVAMHANHELRIRPALAFLIEELAKNGTAVDSLEDLRQRFDPEWPGVEEWISGTLPALDRIVNGVAGLLDPEAIVFGGQIARPLAQTLIERVSFWDENSRYNRPPPRPKLVLSETNGDASALGAALIPLRHHFF